MSDETISPHGCLTALIAIVIISPIFLAAFVYSPATTIAFTIFVVAVARYTWPDWRHWLTSSDQRGNNYTRTRKAENPPREEIAVIARTLLGDPDLDCKATKGNTLTIEESIDIHFKRLKRHGRSRYDGDMEFMGPRGGIYTITASGNRNYR